MTQANLNLRANLQEWTNRLLKSNTQHFGQELKFLFDNFQSNHILKSILDLAEIEHKLNDAELLELFNKYNREHRKSVFQTQKETAATYYQLLRFFFSTNAAKNPYHMILNYSFISGSSHNEKMHNFVEGYIYPITNYIHDCLDESNNVLYLIQKYKQRTEWFTKTQLLEDYNSAEKEFEKIFEDDLRLFLFDQGVEYPFSTPKSTSGRADVVGGLDSNDPIIVEIKILDQKKKYGRARIAGGISQIVNYTEDYHKSFGYLVVFNVDKTQLDFQFEEKNCNPPRMKFGDKTIFIIVVNIQDLTAASKLGKLETMIIKETDLLEISGSTQ